MEGKKRNSRNHSIKTLWCCTYQRFKSCSCKIQEIRKGLSLMIISVDEAKKTDSIRKLDWWKNSEKTSSYWKNNQEVHKQQFSKSVHSGRICHLMDCVYMAVSSALKLVTLSRFLKANITMGFMWSKLYDAEITLDKRLIEEAKNACDKKSNIPWCGRMHWICLNGQSSMVTRSASSPKHYHGILWHTKTAAHCSMVTLSASWMAWSCTERQGVEYG